MLAGLHAALIHHERFVTNAAHDLRPPLTTTRTALEIPLEQGRVPEHLQPAIFRALDANQRSEQLITALLQLARTSSVTKQTAEDSVLISEIIERSLTTYGTDITAARITVTKQLEDVILASADPTLLALAIDNLIE